MATPSAVEGFDDPSEQTADHEGDLYERSAAYLDDLFGSGAGARHTAFIDRLEHPVLRDTLHSYHVLESDTRYLSVTENYLLGMVVLCAQRNYATAAMFAKTLLHLEVPRGKLIEATARLAMWVGGIQAAEAAAHIQKAIGEYEHRGIASLDAWFPPEPPHRRTP